MFLGFEKKGFYFLKEKNNSVYSSKQNNSQTHLKLFFRDGLQCYRPEENANNNNKTEQTTCFVWLRANFNNKGPRGVY